MEGRRFLSSTSAYNLWRYWYFAVEENCVGNVMACVALVDRLLRVAPIVDVGTFCQQRHVDKSEHPAVISIRLLRCGP